MKPVWPITTLGEVCRFLGGGTPSTTVEDYWRGDIPWVSPKDMKSEVVCDSIDHISENAIQSSAATLIPKGSILIVVRSGILKRTIPIALAGRTLTINQDLKALCPSEILDSRFLYYLVKSKIKELLGVVSRGATVHRLTTDHIRNLAFFLPPLPEQHRIVCILDEAFAAIAKAKANTENNLQNALVLFKHLEWSTLFDHKCELVQKEISQCFRVKSGDFLPARLMDHSGVYDVYGGNGIAGRHHKKNTERGSVVIGRVGAKCGNVRRLPEDAWVTDNALIISEYFHSFDLDFLTRLLSRKQLRNTANQAAQPVISYSTIKEVVLSFPASVSEQRTIAERLMLLEHEVIGLEDVYEKKLGALEALKQSLLHQAFSGNL